MVQASQSQNRAPFAFSSAACSANCGLAASSSTVQMLSSRALTKALVGSALAVPSSMVSSQA